MVSETVQKALAKAAQRAARRAEADAGLGGEDDTPNYPNKKLSEALENAKEASRTTATTAALEGRVKEAKLARGASATSTASTVPASSRAVKRSKRPSGGGDSEVSPEIKTPTAKIRRVNTETQGESAPKKPRCVNDEDGKTRRPRSPTVHYSPDGKQPGEPEELEEHGEPEEPEEPAREEPGEEMPERPAASKQPKLTAVKAQAKKKQNKNTGSPVEPKARVRPTPKAKSSAQSAQSPKVETPSGETALAVQQALARGTTADLGSSKKTRTTAHARSKSASSSDGEGSESAAAAEGPDENDTELTLEQVRAQKAARARYMRFSRSFKSKRCPKELKLAHANAKRCSEKLQVLYEQWISCEGHWTESSLYKQLRVTVRNRKTGARKWLTEAELCVKYGSPRVAARIAQAKRNDPKCQHQIRDHPDCPGDPELYQYLVWDVDAEEDVTDHVTNDFFEAIDKDQGGSAGKSDKKKKKSSKKKKKKSTSSDSSEESDDSSSTSEKKKKKKGKKGKKELKKRKSSSSEGSDSDKKKKAKKSKDDKEKNETLEQKAKREQKEQEAKAKEVKKKIISDANKVVGKLTSALGKAALVQTKADSMSPALKNVFLQELNPHKKMLGKRRDQLQKVVDAAKGGGDVAVLAQPQTDGEEAVKNFSDFLVQSNMK